MAAEIGIRNETGQTQALTLIAAAQRLAVTYTNARLSIPQLPAAYQSARPWFVFLGRSVAQQAVNEAEQAR